MDGAQKAHMRLPGRPVQNLVLIQPSLVSHCCIVTGLLTSFASRPTHPILRILRIQKDHDIRYTGFWRDQPIGHAASHIELLARSS